ncbi:acetate/propionate family kinase [Acetobacteraceae bacterium KSS8]|uniref:Acetate kinase n=1 Tax=Endosaccharibacter trunci TaxID=2812733 RepID=A0ABT1W5I0_9PROT|nr:acetate/propionate family kinase [Acetobacteraceae bacterium KSS8]
MFLALNAGSSTLKFALAALDAQGTPRRLVTGQMERKNGEAHVQATDAAGAPVLDRALSGDDDSRLEELLGWLEDHAKNGLAGVGHRIVHGGRAYAAPARITPEVLATLEQLTALAPLHQPHGLAPVRALEKWRPGVKQVACFDTAFHHAMPETSWRYALPDDFARQGIRRYGFHGLSYEYIAGCLRERHPELASGRVVVAHLGNGASLCAMRNGRSVDTTMGFTALDGLVMGTRAGALDPGVVLHMMQQLRMDGDAIEDVLYRRSGLLGLSDGLSSDMRVLLRSDAPAASRAVEMFVSRAARMIAAMAVSLGGIDGLVFTAGIGAHAAPVREKICAQLEWMGVSLDSDANNRNHETISTERSPVAVLRLETDEEAMVIRHTIDTLKEAGRG